MAEAEASIPENTTTVVENSTTNPEKSETIPPTIAQESIEAPAPKRGRPAGSKDRAPRRKVKVEPISAPVEEERQQAALAAPPPTPPPQPTAKPKVAPQRVAREPRPPSPEPPSPRTLYRETSAHLLNLRDMMNTQKRASAVERYTSRLHAWPIV